MIDYSEVTETLLKDMLEDMGQKPKTRLTTRHGKHCIQIGGEWKRHNEAWEKLAHYEDLEEAGRLIELPCKVGDTVYGRMHSYKVIGFTDNELILSYGIEREVYPTHIPFAHIGKTVFLTKAEAEQKLAELKEGE